VITVQNFLLLNSAFKAPEVDVAAVNLIFTRALARASRTCLVRYPDLLEEATYLLASSGLFQSYPDIALAAAGLISAETLIEEKRETAFKYGSPANPYAVAGTTGKRSGINPFDARYQRLLDLYCPTIGIMARGKSCRNSRCSTTGIDNGSISSGNSRGVSIERKMERYFDFFDNSKLTVVNPDLAFYTIAHNLGTPFYSVSLWDSNNIPVIGADYIYDVTENSVKINLASFTPLTGTWTVFVLAA
jgi:hypothetical protein